MNISRYNYGMQIFYGVPRVEKNLATVFLTLLKPSPTKYLHFSSPRPIITLKVGIINLNVWPEKHTQNYCCELVQIFKQEQEDPGVSTAQLATGAHKIKEE